MSCFTAMQSKIVDEISKALMVKPWRLHGSSMEISKSV